MSFCRQNHLHTYNFESFPKQASMNQYNTEPFRIPVPQDRADIIRRHSCKKTSLCPLFRGSYTLEAAVIIPVLAMFFVTILFFFRVLQVQTQVQEALDYAGRKTACEASAIHSQAGLLVSAEAYFQKELKNYELPQKYVSGGKKAIVLLRSDLSGSYIDLRADYYMKLPISFFKVKGLAIQQKSKCHKWIGDREDGEEADYVYVTEHGTVYHISRNCRYLDLSIQTVNMAQIPGKKNKNDHKYYACSGCAAKNAGLGVAYITDYGTCYHTSLSCSGLKRTIYLVRLDKVGDKGPCGKCGGKKNGG